MLGPETAPPEHMVQLETSWAAAMVLNKRETVLERDFTSVPKGLLRFRCPTQEEMPSVHRALQKFAKRLE